MRIALCITTYKRPEGLRRLLASVARLDLRTETDLLDVIVVDNDPKASASGTVEEMSPLHERATLAHVHEPRRGISQARNRAIDEALSRGGDLVAFLDDDEVAEEGWLCTLLRALDRYGADVVTGPVLTEFEREPPEWVVRGGFFDRMRSPTGTARDRAATGNVLLRASVLRETGLRFDERLGLVGGEDQHFFRRLSAQGGTIVWCDEAVVREFVPSSRVNLRWILKRAFRYGSTTTFTDVRLEGRTRAAVRALAVGGYRVLKGSVLLVLTPVRGRHHGAACLRHIAYGLGHIAGLAGIRPREYKVTHGA